MDSESSHIRVDPDMTLHTHPVCSHRARQTTLSLHRHVSSLNGVLSPATSPQNYTTTRNYQPGSAHGSVPSVDISRPGHNQHSARAFIAHQKLKGEVYPFPHQSVSKPPADASAAITAKPPPQTTAPTVNTKALPPHSLKHMPSHFWKDSTCLAWAFDLTQKRVSAEGWRTARSGIKGNYRS